MDTDVTLADILAALDPAAEPPAGYLRAEEWAARWGVTRCRVAQVLRLAQAQGRLEVAKVPTTDISGRTLHVAGYRFTL